MAVGFFLRKKYGRKLRTKKRRKNKRKLEQYKAGTQRRALLAGFTLGALVSLAGIRLLRPIFDVSGGATSEFQAGVFQFYDIVITAGLIARISHN